MQPFSSDVQAAEALTDSYRRLKQEIAKIIVGQTDVIDKLLISLFCRGHVLLVGVPGLAKTLLISTIAQTLDLKFNRIQFTPDLMPGDILGAEILETDYDTNRKSFKFVKGPIFANVLLADEINRTPPKTQSALLEAMQERKVTVAGKMYDLEPPFFVLATQNPIEQEGTYPLPEAQLDRFMFNLFVDYPSFEEEVQIIRATTSNQEATVNPIIGAKEIAIFQDLVRKVPVADNVIEYAVRLVSKTRKGQTPTDLKDMITWGAGPRASQFLILGAKAHALLNGKFSPDIENVRAIAIPVLRHRIVPSFNAEAEGISTDQIIEKLLKS
ncbi:MAG: MoxR family ATPase [Bacteroidia bacterium]|nr:MoxR family ATPase [Bacteroidia bacterium]